ncbi:MAG: diacylglycerol kinase family lipid kinase, partial [Acidobacteriota bacterium]
MSTAAVLVNPLAGGGRAGRLWERWRQQARRLGYTAELVADSAVAALQAVRRLVEEGCERLVVWGGDGTAHLVAGALLEVGAG